MVGYVLIKAINSNVAKEVGVLSAMVFQHICYWMQSQDTDVVYRTNKELVSDLDDSISESQVQRAKKKLIDAGLISVSFENKCRWVRTTYYRLTSKGKKMLLNVIKKSNTDVKKRDSRHDNGMEGTNIPDEKNKASNTSKSKWIPKHMYNQYMKDMHKKEQLEKAPVVPKSMVVHWDEGFKGNENATKIPDHLLNNPILARMIKRK